MRHKLTVLRAAMTLASTFLPLLAQQFNGSTPTGEATSTPLNLSLDDAIARGLKTNLGLLTRENSSTSARVDKMRLLAAMLPTVSGELSMSEQQLSLSTFGFHFPGVPNVIGPFHYQDARANADIPVYDPRT